MFAICSTVFQIVAGATETSPFMLERISTHFCVHLVPYSRYRNVCKGHLGSRKLISTCICVHFDPWCPCSLSWYKEVLIGTWLSRQRSAIMLIICVSDLMLWSQRRISKYQATRICIHLLPQSGYSMQGHCGYDCNCLLRDWVHLVR